ncbi:MAG: hypothetical protein V3T23_03970 [Nitrososphaerales archaeon]
MAGYDEKKIDKSIRSFVRRHGAFGIALKYRVEELIGESKDANHLSDDKRNELDFLIRCLNPCLEGITDAWNELMDGLGRK